MAGSRAIDAASTTGTKADGAQRPHYRHRCLGRLPVLAQLDPLAQLIGVDPVRQREPCHRHPRLKAGIDQALLLNRIKPPLAVAKNPDDPQLTWNSALFNVIASTVSIADTDSLTASAMKRCGDLRAYGVSGISGHSVWFRNVPIALKKSAFRRAGTATKVALLKLSLR